MRRVYLVHWNAAEAKVRAARLQAAGYSVDCAPVTPAMLRKLRQHPPDAVVVDLNRLPAQGRDVGLAVRHYKTTRHTPIVFVDGKPEKVARIKEQLPDAEYTTWNRIRSGLKRAIAHPPGDPAVPRSLLDGYSGTPLAKKLGIKANAVVVLVGAPQGFETALGELPRGVSVRRRASGRHDLTIWFTRSRKDLESRIRRMADHIGQGGLWIAWPKKTSRLAADLTQIDVRGVAMAAGLVDYKVAAIDETWAGLKFTRRKER
jgi:CheY-like chemotaxis protein